MLVIAVPVQIVCDEGVATTTFGIEFTSTVAVMGVPLQPFAVGVMVNVTVTAAAVVFVKAPMILPDPLAAIPVREAVLSLVQLKVMPFTMLLNTTGVIVEPEQIVCEVGVAATVGLGLTRAVAVKGVPLQPFDMGVMVKVAVIGELVLFVKVPLILPFPLAAITVSEAVLFLVQA